MSLDLLVLGAPKAGTTVLHHYLDQHPELAMAEPKEPHFFDVDLDGDFDDYLASHFPDDVTLRRGEATPHSLFVPYVADRVLEHAPEAHLVAVLRDPIDRAYSDWWMYWTRATEPLPFEETIEANLRRLEDGPSFLGDDAQELWPRYYRQTQSGSPGEIELRPYVELGHYADQIERYLRLFDRDQFSIFLSSELREDPEAVAGSIWAEIGLDDHVELGEPEQRNEAMGGLTRRLYALARRFGLERLLHAPPRWMRTKIKQLSSRLDERPPMDAKVRRRLAEHYEPHNQRLAKLVDRDLSHWTSPDDVEPGDQP